MAQARKKAAASVRSLRTAASKKAAAARRRSSSVPVELVQTSINKNAVPGARRGDSVPVLEHNQDNGGDIDVVDHMEAIAEHDGMVIATGVGKPTEKQGEKTNVTTLPTYIPADVKMLDTPIVLAETTQVVVGNATVTGLQDSTNKNVMISNAPVGGLHVEGGDNKHSTISKAKGVPEIGCTTTDTLNAEGHNGPMKKPGQALASVERELRSCTTRAIHSTTESLGVKESNQIIKEGTTSITKRAIVGKNDKDTKDKEVAEDFVPPGNYIEFKIPTARDTTSATPGLTNRGSRSNIKRSPSHGPTATTHVPRCTTAALTAPPSPQEKESLVVEPKFTSQIDRFQATVNDAARTPKEVDVAQEQTTREEARDSADGNNTVVELHATAIMNGLPSVSRKATSIAQEALRNKKATGKARAAGSKKAKASTVTALETVSGSLAGATSVTEDIKPPMATFDVENADTEPPPPAPTAPKKRVRKTKSQIAAAKVSEKTQNDVGFPMSAVEGVQPLVGEVEPTETARLRKRLRRTNAQIAADKAAADHAKSLSVADEATEVGDSSQFTTKVVDRSLLTNGEVAAGCPTVKQTNHDIEILDITVRPSRERKPSAKAHQVEGAKESSTGKLELILETEVPRKDVGSTSADVAQVLKVETSTTTVPTAMAKTPINKKKRMTKAEQAATKFSKVGNIAGPSGTSSADLLVIGDAPSTTNPSRLQAGAQSTQPPAAPPIGQPSIGALDTDIAMQDVVSNTAILTAPAQSDAETPATNAPAKKPRAKRTKKNLDVASAIIATVRVPPHTQQAMVLSLPLDLMKPQNQAQLFYPPSGELSLPPNCPKILSPATKLTISFPAVDNLSPTAPERAGARSIGEPACTDAAVVRMGVIGNGMKLLANVVETEISNIQTKPELRQDDAQRAPRVTRRIRSETPALLTGSRLTRSRGPAAPLADVPRELPTSDWMGNTIQGLHYRREDVLRDKLAPVLTNTTQQSGGEVIEELPDRKRTRQVQLLMAEPQPVGKRKLGKVASSTTANADVPTGVSTGDAHSQPVGRPAAKRARTCKGAAGIGGLENTAARTAATDLVGQEAIPEVAPRPSAPNGNTRRSARTMLAPTRLETSLEPPAPKPTSAAPGRKSPVVVVKGRKYTPDTLEQICILNAPHLAMDSDVVIPSPPFGPHNMTGQALAPVVMFVQKLRPQPPFQPPPLSALPTRRIRLPKEALVFHTSLDWEGLLTLLEDAGQYCCDPAQLLKDEVDLAAHYREQEAEAKQMQSVWYTKEYRDPRMRRIPEVGYYYKPVMGNTEQLKPAELKADMKVLKEGKAEMEKREQQLVERYADVLLAPFTAA